MHERLKNIKSWQSCRKILTAATVCSIIINPNLFPIQPLLPRPKTKYASCICLRRSSENVSHLSGRKSSGNSKIWAYRQMTCWLLQILVPTDSGANLGIEDSPPGPMSRSNGPAKGGCKRRDSLITAWRIGNVERRLFEGGKILSSMVFNSKYIRSCHWDWVAISYKTASIPAAVLPTPANSTSPTPESAHLSPVRKSHWDLLKHS